MMALFLLLASSASAPAGVPYAVAEVTVRADRGQGKDHVVISTPKEHIAMTGDSVIVSSITDLNGNGSVEIVAVENHMLAGGFRQRIVFASTANGLQEFVLENPYGVELDAVARPVLSFSRDSQKKYAYYIVLAEPFSGRVGTPAHIQVPLLVAVDDNDGFALTRTYKYPYEQSLATATEELRSRKARKLEADLGDYGLLLQAIAVSLILRKDFQDSEFEHIVAFVGQERFDRDVATVQRIIDGLFK